MHSSRKNCANFYSVEATDDPMSHDVKTNTFCCCLGDDDVCQLFGPGIPATCCTSSTQTHSFFSLETLESSSLFGVFLIVLLIYR